MAGLYGIVSKNKININSIYKYFYSSNIQNIINEELTYNNMIYGRSVLGKFLDDRILHEDEELIVGFEGIFFNKTSKNSFYTIKAWYQKNGIDFVKDIKGQFCGFIYDKKINKLFIYNDHLSTKPLYFYQNNELFIFASELKVITKLLYTLNIKKELNYDAVYCMLTFGYMLDTITYEKNTTKLAYATILEIDNSFYIKTKKYFEYIKEENFYLLQEDIIKIVDSLLIDSVKNCWSKDDEYEYKHYSFLSGGLDSRVNLFLAKELGFQDVLTMTFSQSNSSDDVISQEIATKEKFGHLFYSLDNGKYLEKNLEKYVNANDGLAILNGSASGYEFLSSINHGSYGALHTGQIGDLLFGSYVKPSFDISSGLMSDNAHLLDKISLYASLSEKYQNNAEVFGYEQRVINGTLNGDRSTACFVDMVSPFYDRDLIAFCLSIPDKYKKDETIYLDWFNAKHPKISNFVWESAGVKPKNINLVKVAKVLRRYKNAILRRLKLNINDMNPFDIWLRNNSKILLNLDTVFSNHIDLIDDMELKNILIKMYNTDIQYSHYGRNNKFLVITLLLSLKLHFKEI